MARSSRKKKSSSNSGWLKLILELIAVFVGITAGFFLNNYTRERADHELEVKYLESLHTDLVADSITIQTHMESNRNNVEISRRAVNTMQTGDYERDSSLRVLGIMATYNDLNIQDDSYESILHSGNLRLIQDFEIRKQIVDYYGYRNEIRSIEEVYNNYIDNYVVAFLFDNVDILAGEIPDDFDHSSRAFRNVVSGYYVLSDQKMELIQTLDSLNRGLKEVILEGL